jgi:hypothetical protein
VKEYRIIQARDTWKLAELVNKAISEGWEISGSLSSVHYIDGVTEYYQPMVKDNG